MSGTVMAGSHASSWVSRTCLADGLKESDSGPLPCPNPGPQDKVDGQGAGLRME